MKYGKQFMQTVLAALSAVSISYAKFGEIPAGWGDIRFGLVSNGVPDAKDTKRLKKATEELGIQIKYRYRYVNEGVDPTKNACVNLFQWKWNADYSKYAKRDAGVEASYVIYVLQEEGGRPRLLSNMADPVKMQQFFHTLRIVAEHANGHGATIVVEPDTWGYFLQENFQNKPMNLEVDPLKIPAVVNNIKNFVVQDSSYENPEKPWDSKLIVKEKPIEFDYLSDLPNNMAGFGRAIIRTLHKYAPDCYVGFLASHWSVNLGLDGKGWSSSGLVWATPELVDTSAKINIEFFNKLYYGSIDKDHPWKPGDSPDFIGVEKNGLCAGNYEVNKQISYWYWGDEQMKTYLKWVKQIAQGLDLPVVGWQISIGNMDNVNKSDEANMADSYKDTFFPYFFKHVDEFVDAGFIGFLVGKGLSNATDYTLPGETVGEKGWFLTQLQAFDKKRPYLDTSKTVDTGGTAVGSISRKTGTLFMQQSAEGLTLSFAEQISAGTPVSIRITNLRGQLVSRVDAEFKSNLFTPTSMIARGSYLVTVTAGGQIFTKKLTLR